jgi:hypothetical protein
MKNSCFAKKFDILKYEITKKTECFCDDDNFKNFKNVKCATIEKECKVTSKSND